MKRSGTGTRCEHIPYLGRCPATHSSLQTVSGMNVSSLRLKISSRSRLAPVLSSGHCLPPCQTLRSRSSRSPGVTRSSACSRSIRGTGLPVARCTCSSACRKSAARGEDTVSLGCPLCHRLACKGRSVSRLRVKCVRSGRLFDLAALTTPTPSQDGDACRGGHPRIAAR